MQENSKFTKSETNPNAQNQQNSKQTPPTGDRVSVIGAWDFRFVSDFEIRIWNLSDMASIRQIFLRRKAIDSIARMTRTLEMISSARYKAYSSRWASDRGVSRRPGAHRVSAGHGAEAARPSPAEGEFLRTDGDPGDRVAEGTVRVVQLRSLSPRRSPRAAGPGPGQTTGYLRAAQPAGIGADLPRPDAHQGLYRPRRAAHRPADSRDRRRLHRSVHVRASSTPSASSTSGSTRRRASGRRR